MISQEYKTNGIKGLYDQQFTIERFSTIGNHLEKISNHLEKISNVIVFEVSQHIRIKTAQFR